MGYGKNVASVLKQQNKSVYWLSKETGIKKTTLYSMIDNDSMPRMENARKISEALNVDFYELQGAPFVRKALNQLKTKRQKDVFELFNKLDATEQSIVIDIVKNIVKVKEHSIRIKTR